MSVPAWPGTLPQVLLRDGYTETGPNNLISSDVSIGPAKVRRRTTAAIRPLSGGLVMTEAQYATFMDFFLDDLKSGAIAFTFPDPHGGSALLARFHQPASISPLGIDWRVDISLEILP